MLIAGIDSSYQKVDISDHELVLSGRYSTVEFPQFPTPPATLHLPLKLYAAGQVRGGLWLCVSRWDHVLQATQPVALDIQDAGLGKKYRCLCNIPGLVFPGPGNYQITVFLDQTTLCTMPLLVSQQRPAGSQAAERKNGGSIPHGT